MINLMVSIFYGSVAIMSIQLASVMKSCLVTKQYISEECTIALYNIVCAPLQNTSLRRKSSNVKSCVRTICYGSKL